MHNRPMCAAHKRSLTTNSFFWTRVTYYYPARGRVQRTDGSNQKMKVAATQMAAVMGVESLLFDRPRIFELSIERTCQGNEAIGARRWPSTKSPSASSPS